MSVLQKYKKLQKKLERERMLKKNMLDYYEFGVMIRKQNKQQIHQSLKFGNRNDEAINHNLVITERLPNMLRMIKIHKQSIRSIQNEISQLLK